MTKIALYDLDKTITKRPTYMPFLLHAAWRHERWRLAFLPGLVFLFAGYLVRALDRARLKELMQAMLLGSQVDAGKMKEMAESFAKATLEGNVHIQALAQIAKEKADGYRLVLATASYAFYAAPLARLLGFDDVIGTLVKRGEDEAILPKIDGENCYGEAKLRMVEAWGEEHGLPRDDLDVRFYSDSQTDLPVFDWSDDPISTNPNAKLRAIAEKRGWRIIAWG
ncbi:HAD family hydrolase [Parasphingopyxis lamellibrachiae]|uniref:HAD superfamily hydrolase (TIGR01490 family) n=1 Tax=Parasphingopyxis lamellibrachiae TaxID=680125 RepID=A0A3D9FG24_9SPHN|nr:HAD-IB family hydrolase [Parasphingopyxis lamellibrachiae]RED16739.1 HAD superfamily hydrolase (TIGR01490 family) [Parasphingopyxis lamellibrachiae]